MPQLTKDYGNKRWLHNKETLFLRCSAGGYSNMDTPRFDYTKMAHMSESFHKLSNSLTTTVSNRIRAAPWALSATLLNNRGCMWVYSQWEGCLTHQYPTIPLFLGGQLIFPEGHWDCCGGLHQLTKLNSALDNILTWFSRGRGSWAGRHNCFSPLISPQNIYPWRWFATCWLADIVGTPIILMNMIFLFYTNDTNDLKMVLNTYN